MLVQFNRFAIGVGIASLGVVAIYPFMKRFTYWPQIFLGLAFSWGALMGWAGARGALEWPAFLLYAGSIAWVIHYDTIYAHQDREDDALVGLKSTALLFGANTKPMLALFSAAAVVLIGAAGYTAHAGAVFALGLSAFAAHLAWQIVRIDIDDPEFVPADVSLQPRRRTDIVRRRWCSTRPFGARSDVLRGGDMTVIDIHTHMIPREWLDLLQRDGGDYELKPTRAGHTAIHLAGAPFVTLMPEMFDYDLRLRAMDEAGVDMAVLSLTGPNVFWGSRETSVKAARIGNAAYAESQRKYPDRIRWVASIPWEYPDDAIRELARARSDGALGVAALANIRGRDLTDPLFEPVWSEIDRPGSAGVCPSDHSAGRRGDAARRIQPGDPDRIHGRHHARVHAA